MLFHILSLIFNNNVYDDFVNNLFVGTPHNLGQVIYFKLNHYRLYGTLLIYYRYRGVRRALVFGALLPLSQAEFFIRFG